MSDEMKSKIVQMMQKKTDIRFEASETSTDEYNLFIYGPIDSYSWSENSSKGIMRRLQGVRAKTINVFINSPGGSGFDGVAIYNLLKNHQARIVVRVDGIAASAASVIAQAGDEVIMPDNTMMMIHRASTIVWGNAAELEKTAADLKKIDTAWSNTYRKRFVGTPEELDQLLDDETYLTAEEAVALGLADVVGDEIEIQELETPAPEDEEEEELEPIDNKERLLVKYGNKNTSKEKEPSKEPAAAVNLGALFLKLK